ncbi:gliding motility-associated ABC transporter substrate-binding protein GldG [Catalinimonas niigatensis]|uniref:gliding motility-associated ABC transporter substrate-binding protein GldG n=1 Tax=Catalinimonas niigatensis TaxID=1397264 RepID=UPI002666B840|nr:gliding motility-associated ABC transporter substrate-binding protein GldG [Catalinimonas niigatensis]WPP51417.1 gliding motility-associated ABC transporter substrate-binding protein GldG [Catalinimonas niigatensis]
MNKTQVQPHIQQKDQRAFWKDISRLGIGLVILIALNILAQNYFFRLDLTEEKRYSISPATKDLLGKVDQEIEVVIYLDGEVNAGFQRLEKSVQETLDEFKVYAGDELNVRYINPLESVSNQEQQQFFLKLADLGIEPTYVYDEEDGQRRQKLIVPGAVINYQGQQAGVMLLNGNRTASPQETLNQSIENVEYELANGIRKLVSSEKKKLGILKGHGEVDAIDIAGLMDAVTEFYEVFEVNLTEQKTIPDYDAILINKPTERFSKEDQYKIDQYIMRGGKVMFFIDPLRINMDSIGENGSIAFPYDLNLDDQLFRYGVRINKTLVQDINSGNYPFVVGEVAGQPQIVSLKWPFFPIVNKYGDHPTVKNMDAVYLRFVSEMDTIAVEGIKKTPLIYTSQYSRVMQTPMIVDLNELREAPDPENFSAGSQAVAYLLEGSFSSLFKNRVLPDLADKEHFIEQGTPSKLVVVADGDLVRNEINRSNGKPFPLGYDPITERNYANKDFVINTLSYLTDENGLINARAKEIQIRPLDQVKIEQSAIFYQIINLLGPIVLIIIFGLVKAFLRKRKYSSF